MLCVMKRGEDQERQQNVRIKDILLGVTSLKLGNKIILILNCPSLNNTFIDSNQFNSKDDWSICCDEFSSDQQIIRLPWNEKHYFHANCIGEWLERKTVWPIWKAPITEEILNKFKRNDHKKEEKKQQELKSDSSFEVN